MGRPIPGKSRRGPRHAPESGGPSLEPAPRIWRGPLRRPFPQGPGERPDLPAAAQREHPGSLHFHVHGVSAGRHRRHRRAKPSQKKPQRATNRRKPGDRVPRPNYGRGTYHQCRWQGAGGGLGPGMGGTPAPGHMGEPDVTPATPATDRVCRPYLSSGSAGAGLCDPGRPTARLARAPPGTGPSGGRHPGQEVKIPAMASNDWLPLATTALGAVLAVGGGGLAQWAGNRRSDSRARDERRRAAYGEFIAAADDLTRMMKLVSLTGPPAQPSPGVSVA
jgi:hypothetical protein